MAEITQTISSLPVVEGRYGSDFIQQADAFLNTLPNWSPQLNYFARQANDLRNEVNGFRSTTYNYMTTTKNYMNSAYAYKTDAESAANAIKSYVIPEEATYSKDDLDSNHNNLLTALTATQAQVSTIANFLPELADYKLRNVDSKYVKESVENNINGTLVKLTDNETEIVKQDNTWIKNQVTAWIVGGYRDGVIVIDASYNIDSVVRQDTGVYNFYFSKKLKNKYYAILADANALGDGGNAGGLSYVNDPYTGDETYFQYVFRQYDNSGRDKRLFTIIVIGGM